MNFILANILVVDDDPAILRIVSRVLGIDGHHVLTAESRKEALLQVQADISFDVFILDFWLGDENGLDVMRDLVASCPKTPILFLSGGNQDVPLETTTALAEMHGACEFLYKPIGTTDLLEAVRRYI